MNNPDISTRTLLEAEENNFDYQLVNCSVNLNTTFILVMPEFYQLVNRKVMILLVL